MGETKINDIGCCAFQFYKQLICRTFPYDYFGFDDSQEFLDIGLRQFPELSHSYWCGDFLKCIDPRMADITVVSATLEHISEWKTFLQKILNSSRDMVIIRTFFGETTKLGQIWKQHSLPSYSVWQFSTDEFCGIAGESGWRGEFRTDLATGSRPTWINGHPGSPGLARTCQVAVLTKS